MSGMDTAVPSFEVLCEFKGDYAQIPPHMQEAIRSYVIKGIAPGHFLQGVITNDLRMAVNHADMTNLPLLKLYAQWFYNVAPGNCHGSLQAMMKWLLERRQEQENA